MNSVEKIDQILKEPFDFFESLSHLELRSIEELEPITHHLKDGYKTLRKAEMKLRSLITYT